MNLIKIVALGVLISFVIIATYTDIKKYIIPNILTFTLMIFGITLSTYYFLVCGHIRYTYYASIIIVFLFCYILWKLGLWAGGDVKLITAMSTICIPEYLNIIPQYSILDHILPSFAPGYIIPIFYVIIAAIFSVVPVIIVLIIYETLKNKRYLITKLKKSINLNETINTLNILYIVNIFLTSIHIDVGILKWVILAILTFALKHIIPKDIKITALMLMFIIIFNNSLITSYVLSFIFLECILLFISLLKSGLLSEVMSDKYPISELSEGMVLTYPLKKEDDKYICDASSSNDNIIIKSNIYGLESDELGILKKLNEQNKLNYVYIKKTIFFAPFILVGLLVTLLIGNPISFMKIIIGMIISGL